MSVNQAGNRPGFRAAEAYVRPSPIATHGSLVSYGFDLRNCTFTMSLSALSPTKEDAPTEIFLPEYHFPDDAFEVELSGGKWSTISEGEDEDRLRRLRWWHAEGGQTITVKGVRRRQGVLMGPDAEDESYIEQCRQWLCTIM